METHKVLDMIYTEDEGQECFSGTYGQCFDFVAEQMMCYAYKIVPLTREEKESKNSIKE